MSGERPERPSALEIDTDGVAEALRDRDHWLVWRYEWQDDREEWAKVPKDGAGGGYRIDATDPANGVAFGVACKTYESGGYDGLGIITNPDDLLVGFDFDDCRDPEQPHGSVPEVVGEAIAELDTYIEVSPSGTGYRGFALGTKPEGPNRADLPCEPVLEETPHLEMYDGTGGRYLTVTGRHVSDTPESVETRPQEIKAVYTDLIADGEDDGEGAESAPSSVPSDPVDLEDSELLEKAKNAKNGDEFARLWNGDTSMHSNDHSRADLALCGHLAFWTGGDRHRMDRLFRRSGLMRDKWDEDRGAQTYGERTIDKALEGRTDFYDPTDAGNQAPQTATDGGATVSRDNNSSDTGDAPTPSAGSSWDDIRDRYKAAEQGDESKNSARYEAAEMLMDEIAFANREVDDVLFAYDDDIGIYEENGESVIRQRAREGLAGMFARQEVGELCEHVRAARTFHIDELGGPEWHIALDNGVLRVERDGSTELLEHDPEYMFLNKAGTEFDPDADCPRWLEYLDEVVTSESDRKKLQEYVGYCLMHWDLPFHKSLFLVGPQASGKSTFADTVRELLGGRDNVASMAPQQMTERFGTAELFGKWANIRNDIPADTISEVGTFKEIIAGDPIKAERKGKDLFMFKPTAKHIFAGNTLPDAEVDDGAFYRRILLVPFPMTIPPEERDKQLDEKLREELPGILNWALEGLGRLLDQHGFTGDLDPAATAETWDKWGSTIDRFASVCIDQDIDAEPKPKSEIYNTYQRFCQQENFPAEPQRKFTRRLKTEHGVQDGKATVDGRQERCFLQIKYTSRGMGYVDDGDNKSGADNSGLDSF